MKGNEQRAVSFWKGIKVWKDTEGSLRKKLVN
jgi:hypothetical protein